VLADLCEPAPSRTSACAQVAVRRLYLRLLAVVYACAFGSLLVQIGGLIGEGGILPAREWLDAVRAQTGVARYWLVPTLCWLGDSDAFLHTLCAAGLVLSVLVFCEVAVAPSLGLLWVLYLSLAVVGQDFLTFQWDSLLLEAGFLSIFLAPWGLSRQSLASAVPAIPRWLLRWLLFRLMFFSGVVKLASGDPTWRELTALRVHYETQPLPTPAAWYAHQLPGGFQMFAVVVMFAVELVLPWLIFAPRRLRIAAAAGFVGLQGLIALTGNYAFFNVLTIALCVLLLDDEALPARWRGTGASLPGHTWPKGVLIALVALVGVLSGVQVLATLGVGRLVPRPVVAFYRMAAPFEIVNGYGLFAVMTTTRREILVEGCDDGTHWLAYEFRFKPGDPRRVLPLVAPHQPRLDWQMWFAALGPWEDSRWFEAFEARLLTASPSVLRLLDRDPFGGRPPQQIRARLFQYRFTTPAERRPDGAVWAREELGAFGPTLVLRHPAP
jgi:lipase maturation factor 1